MSRRWTGWVLTAAAIAAGPAPALSSNESPQTQRTIVAQAEALPPAGGYADCLEVTTPHVVTAIQGGDVVVLKRPYPTSKANGDLRLDKDMSTDTEAQLRSKGTSDAAPWLLLPEGKVAPQGAVRPTAVHAACGIPKGLTLLAPDDAPSSAATIVVSAIAIRVGSAAVN